MGFRDIIGTIAGVAMMVLGATNAILSLIMFLLTAKALYLAIMAIGAVYMITGLGIAKGSRWAWILGLLLCAANIVGALLVRPIQTLSLVVNAILAMMLIVSFPMGAKIPTEKPGSEVVLSPEFFKVSTVHVKRKSFVRKKSSA